LYQWIGFLPHIKFKRKEMYLDQINLLCCNIIDTNILNNKKKLKKITNLFIITFIGKYQREYYGLLNY